MPSASSTVDSLRAQWNTLCASTLPQLALSKSPVQSRWPVELDHSFSQIIFDHVIGEGKEPWTRRLKDPAAENMSVDQLRRCLEVGERIASGEINLVEMEQKSMAVRGKVKRQKSKGKQQKSSETKDESDFPLQKKPRTEYQRDNTRAAFITWTTGSPPVPLSPSASPQPSPSPSSQDTDLAVARRLIHSSNLTPFRRLVLLALTQIPRGRYTTYAAISAFLKSSPRAVGNGIRNNPFAPTVPCHRVLAADGSIGGFEGDWGAGERIEKKIRLLREEGVKLDGRGKVVGQVWRDFK